MSGISASTKKEVVVGALGLDKEADELKKFFDENKMLASYYFWKTGKRPTKEVIGALGRYLVSFVTKNINKYNNEYNKLDKAAHAIKKKNGESYTIPKICKEMSASIIDELKTEAARRFGEAISESVKASANTSPEAAEAVAEVVEAFSEVPKSRYSRLRNGILRHLRTIKTHTPNNLRKTTTASVGPSGISGRVMEEPREKSIPTLIEIASIQSIIEGYNFQIRNLEARLREQQDNCLILKSDKERKCSVDKINKTAFSINEIKFKKIALEELLESVGIEKEAAAGAGSSGGKRKTRCNRRRHNRTRKNRA